MFITDRFARRLVADKDLPAGVLLIERGGDLQVEILTGSERDVAVETRRQLAQQHATSATLIVRSRIPSNGLIEERCYVFGETEEGESNDRGYRVRPCGRRRRLTPLIDEHAAEVAALYRPLFAVHRVPASPVDVLDLDPELGKALKQSQRENAIPN
jgi:hypothetical protein